VRRHRRAFGGAKGGVTFTPKSTLPPMSAVTRRYISQLGDLLGPHTDIPAPDVYSRCAHDGVVYDTYSMMHPGRNNLGVARASRLDMGGSHGRNEATARGVVRHGTSPGAGVLADATASTAPRGDPRIRQRRRQRGPALPRSGASTSPSAIPRRHLQ